MEDHNFYIDFRTFVRNRKNINGIAYFHAFMSQVDQLIDFEGKINFDFIGHQENLESELIDILTILNVDVQHTKHLYNNIKNNKTHYTHESLTSFYDEDTFNFVNEHFAKDFETFNYKKYESYHDFKKDWVKDNEKPPDISFVKIETVVEAKHINTMWSPRIPKNIIQTYKNEWVHPVIHENIKKPCNV